MGDETDDTDEWTGIPVRQSTKSKFDTFRRRVEASVDRDLSQDEMIEWLLEHTTNPEDL